MIDIKALSIEEFISQNNLIEVKYPIITTDEFNRVIKEEEEDGNYKTYEYENNTTELNVTKEVHGNKSGITKTITRTFIGEDMMDYYEDSTGIKIKNEWIDGVKTKTVRIVGDIIYIDGKLYEAQS